MTGTFTWERRYFGQLLCDCNDLLRSTTDILLRDLGNAFLGKSLKESLEGSNNSIANGKHFIKRNLEISHATLFVEVQLIKLLVDSINKCQAWSDRTRIHSKLVRVHTG